MLYYILIVLNNFGILVMFFLISTAMADVAPVASSGGFMSFLPILFFIGVIYFLLIRPQQKRSKQHQALIASIKKGDKVVTNSGIIGTVVKVLNDQEILIEIADKVFVKFVKSTISSVVNSTLETPKLPNNKQGESPKQNDSVVSKKVEKKTEDFSVKLAEDSPKENSPKIEKTKSSNRKYYQKKKPADKTEEPKK